jgi:hypothetical protein
MQTVDASRAACASYGFQPGSDAFVNCVMMGQHRHMLLIGLQGHRCCSVCGCSHSGSHVTRRWRETDSNFRFPERSVKRQGRARGEITDPLSSFVSLPYGYPATSCVGINPKNLNRPPKR